jgi:hypothetical protein
MSGTTDYYYNNAIYDNTQQPWDIDKNSAICPGGGTVYFYNNTFANTGGKVGHSTSWNGYFVNNHWINSGWANGISETNGLYQTLSEATLSGYTADGDYAPTTAIANGIGGGMNLSNVFKADKRGISRPATGSTAKWDIGAYQFSATADSSSGNSPAAGLFAPSGLRIVSQ